MRRIALLAAVGSLVVSTPGRAQVFNGGIPSGYTCTGTCGVSGANGDLGLAPGGGTQFAYVTTNGSTSFGNPLGIVGTTNGSRLTSTTFGATAGQTLSFAFNYITSDGTLNFTDYAFARLVGMGGASNVTLFTARTTPGGNTVPGFGLPPVPAGVTLNPTAVLINAGATDFDGLGSYSGSCYRGIGQGCGATGWVFAAYLLPTDGDYQLELGVSNVGDTEYDSALAFDFALGVNDVPTAPDPGVVPEPATVTLLGVGLMGLATLARRRRSNA
jgi:hypothetical protein